MIGSRKYLAGASVDPTDARKLTTDGSHASPRFIRHPFCSGATPLPGGPAEMVVWAPTTPAGATLPTIASLATPTASHCFANDTVSAMNDGVTPKNSSDETRRRFTWWDHKGTDEWAQYDFDQPRRVGAASVYWWDDGRLGATASRRRAGGWSSVSRTGRGSRSKAQRIQYEAGYVQYGPVRPRRDDSSSHRGEAPAEPLGWNPPVASVPGAIYAGARSALIPARSSAVHSTCSKWMTPNTTRNRAEAS